MAELTAFVNGLASGDFAAALLSARKLSRSDRNLAEHLLVNRWAEIDPDAALAFAASNKDFSDITGAVFQQLAGGDLQDALSRAQALTDPNMRYQALLGALGVMAEQDPVGALQLAATFGNFPNNEPLSQAIYRQWAAADPLAAASIAAQDTSSSGWRSPLTQVIHSWAAQDPQAALSYALTITDPEAQSRSIGDVVRQWSSQDPTAAANWINTLPAGSARDAAIGALASAVASTDLNSAVGWAQSISDEAVRTSALQRVSRRVLWGNPTNGTMLLENAGVPAQIIQSLPPPRQ
jgi:hypothetical protein